MKKNKITTTTTEMALDILKGLGDPVEWDNYVNANTWKDAILAFPSIIVDYPYMIDCPEDIAIAFFKDSIAYGKMKLSDFPIALRKSLI